MRFTSSSSFLKLHAYTYGVLAIQTPLKPRPPGDHERLWIKMQDYLIQQPKLSGLKYISPDSELDGFKPECQRTLAGEDLLLVFINLLHRGTSIQALKPSVIMGIILLEVNLGFPKEARSNASPRDEAQVCISAFPAHKVFFAFQNII